VNHQTWSPSNPVRLKPQPRNGSAEFLNPTGCANRKKLKAGGSEPVASLREITTQISRRN